MSNTECENKKISFIVPVYNIEKYVEKCIYSIIKQTYKNIEIIAIDDGSTDKSGQVLDNIAKTEERLKIIHKKNAGVSAARNDGIDIAGGDYIVFVDGDDYISDDYAEYMLRLAESGADFCLSVNCFTNKNEGQTKAEVIKQYSSSDTTALLLSCDVIVGCWNKIYKRSFLIEKNLRFSTSLFYGEGLSFITMVSQNANFVTIGNRKVYYYRRNNELSACTAFNIEKIYNGESAIKNINKSITKRTDKIEAMINLHLCMFYLGAIVRMRMNNFKKRNYSDYKRWLKYIRKNIFSILTSKYISMYRKILLLTGCISPKVLVLLDAKRRKKISKQSV